MDIIRPEQGLILVIFFLAIGMVWLIVRKNSSVMKGFLGDGRRIKFIEAARLSPTEKAILFSVNNREFMAVLGRGNTPALVELGDQTPSTATPADEIANQAVQS